MTEAWSAYFGVLDGVEIVCGDITGQDADALVVPVTSFGRLDGGLPQPLLDLLGAEMQGELQGIVRAEYDGEMLVGQAEIVLGPNAQFPRWSVPR